MLLNHVRRSSDLKAGAAKRARAEQSSSSSSRLTKTPATPETDAVHAEQGTGSPQQPYRLPLRSSPNDSGCLHCPTTSCMCIEMQTLLDECYAGISDKRRTEHYRRRDLCAKSVLPEFVARLVRASAITSNEVFYDLGCGNGSVLFQVAAMTGARCVGIEIDAHNAGVARQAWERLRPLLEAKVGRSLHVEIRCADFCTEMQDAHYFGQKCVIWAANLLLPPPINHFLSERLRAVPSGTHIFALADLYPHGRSVAALRDPDAFEKFEMADFRWQPMSVEWCVMEGSFYRYTKR